MGATGLAGGGLCGVCVGRVGGRSTNLRLLPSQPRAQLAALQPAPSRAEHCLCTMPLILAAPPPPPPRPATAPQTPAPATVSSCRGSDTQKAARLIHSRVVVKPTVTDKQQMRPAGVPRHDRMAASGDVVFGGQAGWLARGVSTPRLAQPSARGERSAALARKHMRSDVDECATGGRTRRPEGQPVLRPARRPPHASLLRGRVVFGRDMARLLQRLAACETHARTASTAAHPSLTAGP